MKDNYLYAGIALGVYLAITLFYIINRYMKVGTKSVLFGVHCFFIHPVFVFIAWWKLYGFPYDPRLWITFIVHDLGYIGKPNMDGVEGETHPELGARIMAVFGKKWADFTRYHSRYYAKKNRAPYSKLCVADKLAPLIEPYWLYMARATLSGEVYEYMGREFSSKKEWYSDFATYMREWVKEHRDLKVDSWTQCQN